jgi:cytochrome c peroxidase
MLTARDPILCNQCHVPHPVGGIGALRGQPGVQPPAVPPQTRPAVTPLSSGINTVNIWQGRSCLNCHTQVHGSNNPSAGSPAPSKLFR